MDHAGQNLTISPEWLKGRNAPPELLSWLDRWDVTDGVKAVKKLVRQNDYAAANWLLVQLMPYPQYVYYALRAAQLCSMLFHGDTLLDTTRHIVLTEEYVYEQNKSERWRLLVESYKGFQTPASCALRSALDENRFWAATGVEETFYRHTGRESLTVRDTLIEYGLSLLEP